MPFKTYPPILNFFYLTNHSGNRINIYGSLGLILLLKSKEHAILIQKDSKVLVVQRMQIKGNFHDPGASA